jgi:hypothetical protein
MTIELNRKTAERNIKSTRRTDIKPTSVRLNAVDLDRLEAFKNVLRERTGKETISDTVAIRMLIALGQHATKSSLDKVCGEVL